jgi:hypothetical protein
MFALFSSLCFCGGSSRDIKKGWKRFTFQYFFAGKHFFLKMVATYFKIA